MKIIEIINWDKSDYHWHQYTESIWINENLSPKTKVDLGDFSKDKTPERLHKKLKKAGFKKVETPDEIEYGEDL